jgi:nucleotidyltransferase substrate binding protein (TIGR01987 family)
MEELKKRYQVTYKSLKRFEQDIIYLDSKNNDIIKYYEQFRSSAIQSFECCVDTLWKFIKEYLVEVEKINFDSPTPRSVFRQCWILNLIDEDEFNLVSKLIADRNLTAHSYNEIIAEDIVKKLPDYYNFMHKIMNKIDISKL